jgi:hypothetical protein
MRIRASGAFSSKKTRNKEEGAYKKERKHPPQLVGSFSCGKVSNEKVEIAHIKIKYLLSLLWR